MNTTMLAYFRHKSTEKGYHQLNQYEHIEQSKPCRKRNQGTENNGTPFAETDFLLILVLARKEKQSNMFTVDKFLRGVNFPYDRFLQEIAGQGVRVL